VIDFDALLRAHTPSLSDENDAEIVELVGRLIIFDEDVDVADLARRTCHCGTPIDGFYDYVDHLRVVAFNPTPEEVAEHFQIRRDTLRPRGESHD
jgi:hypothetical protein